MLKFKVQNQYLEIFKMNKALFIFFTLFCFLSGGASSAIADEGHKPYVGSKALERMKQLAGNWEGEGDFGKGIEKVKANYRLTSANSTIIETFHMGMPQEMVSVYHDDKNKKLTMTHYCAVANQPKLVLTELGNNKVKMDLSSDSDIDVAHEMHIHSFTVEFEGPDKMIHRWTSYAEGKKAQVVKVVFTRQ